MMADVTAEIRTRSGHTVRQVLPCARRGTIKACRVIQWDDDEALYDGFSYSLWAAAEACPPGLLPNDSPDHPDPWDRLHHGIGEPGDVAKGQHERLKDDKPDTEADWPYQNKDHGGSSTNMKRQIYIEIIDHGPQDEQRAKTYKVFLTIEPKTS